MTYAQINQNTIVNTVDIEDVTLIPLFSEGYDLFLRVDILLPTPSIGWAYSPVSCSFSPPLTLAQQITTNSVAYGNQIILQWDSLNLESDIYDAGKTGAFLSYVGILYQLLSLGYLKDSVDTMTAMIADTSSQKTNLDPFLTNDILSDFQLQIQTFLLTLPSLE